MNILITGAWQSATMHFHEIESMGHIIKFLQYEKNELPCPYEWAEGVICNGLFLYHDISKFTNLKYIQLTSAGYDRIPMDYVSEHGIAIYNARGVYSIPMAEFALCGVLQLYKQMPFFHENQKQKKWIKHRGLKELYGQTVCIIGCGSVGTECAKRFKAFGTTVIGVDLAPYKNDIFDDMVHIDELDTVLPSADVVILTVPLTDKTKYLINRDRLRLFKHDSVLVNISRGTVINTEDLIKELAEGILAGVVLDVFEEEPLNIESPLWDMENVIVTPHNSFVGNQNSSRLSAVILKNLSVHYSVGTIQADRIEHQKRDI